MLSYGFCIVLDFFPQNKNQYIYIFIYLHIYLSIHLHNIYISIYLSIHLSIYTIYIYPYICRSINPSIYLSAFLYLLLLLLLCDEEAEDLLGLDHVVLVDVELTEDIVDLSLIREKNKDLSLKKTITRNQKIIF